MTILYFMINFDYILNYSLIPLMPFDASFGKTDPWKKKICKILNVVFQARVYVDYSAVLYLV